MHTTVVFGYHDPASPRQWTALRELSRRGCNVRECRTSRRGFIAKIRDLFRQWRAVKAGADAVLVTFPGHYLVPFAWLLTRRPRRRLMFDAFVSLHDSIVDDRGLVARGHPYAWFLWCVDWLSCRLADEVWVDTEAQRQFFIHKFHLEPERVKVVYLEARSDLFTSKKIEEPTSYQLQATSFSVFFYGTFIPLQGVEHILDAASIVEREDPRVRFTLVGSGQTERAMKVKAAALGLKNVEFRPFVALSALPDMIRGADLCLGIFGTTGKARRVIPHKVYDAVACGVPVLTADTPAIRERFADHPLVILCEAGNPRAIAHAILARAQRRKD